MRGSPPSPGQTDTRPTWLVRVRSADLEGDREWRDLRVAATSPAQAEAILRRRGLDVDPATIRSTADAPDPARPAPLGVLRCLRCGYVLDGLRVSNSVVDCPECGRAQVVVAWTNEPKPAPQDGIVHALAIIGGIAVGIVGLIAGLLILATFM